MHIVLLILYNNWEAAYQGRPCNKVNCALRQIDVATYLLLKLFVVHRIIGVQDSQLVIFRSVLVEQQLCQEWKVLGVPDVVCVAGTECETAKP
jgi:hypothetical protein